MMNTVGVISLGCSKNRVDTEYLLSYLAQAGFVIVQKPADAEILIVNTCGFITPAKQESIDTILEMAQYKTKGNCSLLVVTGCLSQRYFDELKKELPEVDIFWGVKDYITLAQKLAALAGKENLSTRDFATRILTTPNYSAYLRIADGCNNLCTYCAIPLIRGQKRSVPMDNLLHEAKTLIKSGVVELTAIAQDTSAYGIDIYGRPMLKELLGELASLDGLTWLRVLYAYPNTVDEALVDEMLKSEKIIPYLDIPIQHISQRMLTAMNRHGTREHIERILKYIRSVSPDFILRTTVMVGFPGETEDDFKELYDFISTHPFDRLGAFIFSPEDGTHAAEMPAQVDEETAQARLDAIMKLQRGISLNLNQKRVGKTYRVLTEEIKGETAFGRSYAEAPEVDGSISFIRSGTPLKEGEFAHVRITSASHYDLQGEQV
ncbi:MAG TPA: 30S ribosomal protein S12 methylthiotransferase RimO [Clostridia bacterium]|nr:30S ribosomal protein S12 methylthiotransferase RimO [Clostridia bacterium]